MEPGYLLVEVHPERTGTVRLVRSPQAPSPQSPRLRFCARFEDVDAALMHAHEGLRRCLVDVDRRLYRSSVTTAVAVVEAVELPHRRTYLHPDLDADPILEATIARLHARHRRWDRIFNGVGIGALILLIVLSVLRI
jgi:hypothetical protein